MTREKMNKKNRTKCLKENIVHHLPQLNPSHQDHKLKTQPTHHLHNHFVIPPYQSLSLSKQPNIEPPLLHIHYDNKKKQAPYYQNCHHFPISQTTTYSRKPPPPFSYLINHHPQLRATITLSPQSNNLAFPPLNNHLHQAKAKHSYRPMYITVPHHK